MKTGTLILIRSKNAPVFKTPMKIRYQHDPVVGEAFLFSSKEHSSCNLSTTKSLAHFFGFVVIVTRNSYYLLRYANE